ncbi:MAG: hypothetical protein R3E95_06520 [Thiolinea sp.]
MNMLLRALMGGLLLGFTLMWLSSYTHYTSLGLDHDRYRGQAVEHAYYRIHWNGHGEFWAGFGTQLRPQDYGLRNAGTRRAPCSRRRRHLQPSITSGIDWGFIMLQL